MPTGAWAGKDSKHISKFYCRCRLQEDDTHLFFLCAFARAAWFNHPWYIKIDQIVANHTNMTHILSHILSITHPYASIENVLTFMWCLWKAWNDYLFNRKYTNLKKINDKANAIHNNMELLNVLQESKNVDNSQRREPDDKSKENLANQVQTQNDSLVQPIFHSQGRNNQI
jgi:hypothetical protein